MNTYIDIILHFVHKNNNLTQIFCPVGRPNSGFLHKKSRSAFRKRIGERRAAYHAGELLPVMELFRGKTYVVGMDIARQLNERMLPGITNEFADSPDSIVAPLLYRGFEDALLQDTTLFTMAAAETYFAEREKADKAAKEEKLYGPNRDAGIAFLAENAKKDSVITLPSGLQYKVLVAGKGEVPTVSDKVQVNYEGRLIDGTVFDASARHGDKPAEFMPTQVIKGWTEALTMMPVGSKWQLYIPSELAYGKRETGQIKPYSTLVFDVELVGIVKK